MAREEQDVWQWFERLLPEFELLRATNRKLAARVQELERMTGGALALTDEELIAALPHRVSRALRSAQRTSYDVIERAREREELLLQQAAEAAETIAAQARGRAEATLQEAEVEAAAIVREAGAQAGEVVRKAQARAEALLEEARAEADTSRRRASAEIHQRLERAEARGREVVARAAEVERRVLRELSSRQAELDQQFEQLEAARLEMLELVARLADEALGGGPGEARQRPGKSSTSVPEQTAGVATAEPTEAPGEAGRSRPPRPRAAPARRPLDVLLVSNANVFRSPTAQVLLQRRLEEIGVPATVKSAGLRGEGERPSDSALAVLGPRGIDIGSHRSTPLTRRLLVAADLVVGMAPSHVAAAVHMLPDALPYSFTLKELIRTGRRIGPRAEPESLRQWLARAHATRDTDRQEQFLGNSDFFEDPKGQPGEVYERLVVELTRSVDQLVALLWPEETRRRARRGGERDAAGGLRRMPARAPAASAPATRARPA